MHEDRGGFLRRAALAAAGAVAAGLPVATAAAGTGRGAADVEALAFLLELERLKAAFYREAEAKGFILGEELVFARVAHTHDETHAGILADAIDDLGRTLPRPRRYGFRGVTTDPYRFPQIAIALEETAVGAYVGQADAVRSRELRRQLASILAVEGGQATWIRELAGVGIGSYPSPTALAPSLTRAQVDAIVDSTGFVVA